MTVVNRITCPTCNAPLKRVRGIRIGKKIACPKCRIAFTVRPEDAEKAERAAGVNSGRLGIVLAGAMIYLLVGAVLAVYCFTHNAAPKETTQAESRTEATEVQEDSDGTSALPKPPAPSKQAAVSPAQQRKIDDAIAAGVWYLKDHAQPTGGWAGNEYVGFAALAGLTLLECGVPDTDPIIQNAAALVRRQTIQLGKDTRAGDRIGSIRIGGGNHVAYQVALAILFLDRLGAYEDDDLIRYLALCVMAAQHPTEGAWSYNCPELERAMVPRLQQMLADEGQSLQDWRGAALHGATTFNPGDEGSWDNSNTQFALLALWVARRHQVPVDKSLALAEKHFRATQLSGPQADPDGNNQDLDGSWYYAPARRSWSRWPSMTCSGLLGLAVGHGITHDRAEKKDKPLDDEAIRRGLAMLAREIDRPDERRGPDVYYLWSLQRVGVIFELNSIDGKDWYAWGVNILLPLQHNDGGWHDGGFVLSQPIPATCFALLFLKRANLAKDLTDKLQLLGRPAGGAPSPQKE